MLTMNTATNIFLISQLLAVCALAEITDGVFFINSCANDAPCCIEGYIGISKEGDLAFNLAGFSSYCESNLIQGFDECIGYVDEKLPGAYFGEVVLPHPTAGPQTMQLTFTKDSVQIKNTGNNRIIASAAGTRMTSLEEGVRDGVVRDPVVANKIERGDSRQNASNQATNIALEFLLATVFGILAYAIGGVVYVRRNGGSWDGPWRHIHGSIFAGIASSTSEFVSVSYQNIKSSVATRVSNAKSAIQGQFGMVKEKIQSMRRTSSTSTVIARTSFSTRPNGNHKNNNHDQESMEGAIIVAMEEGSGSPSKARRSKRDWSLFKPIPMSEELRSPVIQPMPPGGREKPLVISSPERRSSLSHRTHDAKEIRSVLE